jgi:hypothetical protein
LHPIGILIDWLGLKWRITHSLAFALLLFFVPEIEILVIIITCSDRLIFASISFALGTSLQIIFATLTKLLVTFRIITFRFLNKGLEAAVLV